jgi:hypothetical protein
MIGHILLYVGNSYRMSQRNMIIQLPSWTAYPETQNDFHFQSLCEIKVIQFSGIPGGSVGRKKTSRKYCKGKAIPLQAWTGPEGSRRKRLPDFKTTDILRW